jgi:hypothetical protein
MSVTGARADVALGLELDGAFASHCAAGAAAEHLRVRRLGAGTTTHRCTSPRVPRLDGADGDCGPRSLAARRGSLRRCRRFLMANGTTKKIADIEVGDEVLATDPTTGEAGGRNELAADLH